jgi:hypothetical protein
VINNNNFSGMSGAVNESQRVLLGKEAFDDHHDPEELRQPSSLIDSTKGGLN